MPPATLTAKNSESTDTQFADRSTRLLLAVWGWGAQDVLKGKLTARLKRKGEKSGDYQDVFAQLQDKGAITIAAGKVAISDQGIDLLGQHLKGADLEIEGTIVGAWMAKALCKWIQQAEVSASASATNGKVAGGAIASYEEFKTVALEVYERLNRDYNMDNLVPIYRIRREIGDRVSRSQFNDWMLELQANDLLQLIGGEMPSLTPDKAEDSIETKLGGVRYYVKLL